MALVNRDKDQSEQKEVLQVVLPAMATGASAALCVVPWPCLLEGYFVAGFGVSGSPLLALNSLRGASGGVTAFAVGISGMTLVGYGVSAGLGVQGMSGIPTLGSSLSVLSAGDVLSVSISGANSAVGNAIHSVVLKKLQDVVSQLGINT